jgi:phosphate transport system substrate-binding protein
MKIINSIPVILLVLLLAIVTVVTGCDDDSSTSGDGDETSGFIKIIGSNTVTPITAVWAEAFMEMYSDISISVSGPGSGVGIAALINGTTDICQASRGIKDKEIQQAMDNGIDPHEIQVATDALAVVVHPSNPITELTIEQLSAIYSGKITNWKELGGEDATIVALARDTSSGTHVFFKEHVVQMKGLTGEDKSLEYGSKVQLLPSTEEGIVEVGKNSKAIFYPGLGYLTDDVKPLGIKTTAADPAVLPSVETALDGTYPIARPLLFYTNGEPTGAIKLFVDYCLSPEGQAQVTEVGYVPL